MADLNLVVEEEVARIEVQKAPKIKNYPPTGTRVRATLNESVMIGTVVPQSDALPEYLTVALGVAGGNWFPIDPRTWTIETIEDSE